MTHRPTGPAATAGRILVVEDSSSARRLLQDVLLRLGAELPNLRIASSVVEALTLFTQWRPDVVFVDVELRADASGTSSPKTSTPSDRDPKDGGELAALFLARNPRVRVIVCSASDPTDPRVAELVEQHRVEFITKPILAARVEAVLTQHRPERELLSSGQADPAPRPRR
jgi:CheY-like chemotaxis protein